MSINPELFLAGAQDIFSQDFLFSEKAKALAAKLSGLLTRIETDRPDVILSWLQSNPQVRRYRPPTPLGRQHLLSDGFIIPVEDFGFSVEVPLNELNDDQVGGWNKQVANGANVAMIFPLKLLAAQIVANVTTWDGSALFANSHTFGTGDNLLAQTGTTVVDVQTDVRLALSALASFVDPNSEPLNLDIEGAIVEYGRGMKGTMEVALDAETWLSASTNPTKIFRLAEPMYNPYLGGNGFIVHAAGGAVAPFIDVVRLEMTTFENRIHETPDEGNYTVFGAKGRRAIAAGHWFRSVIVGSVTGPTIVSES